MTRLLVLASCCLGLICLPGTLIAAEPAPAFPIAWEVSTGIRAPESVYVEPASGAVFVSNIGDGGPAKKDGDGYIAKLTLTGKVVANPWVKGLNAPKGIRSYQDTLWVSDIDRLIGISIRQAKIIRDMPVPGAKFLNDVACGPDGAVYVSDTSTSRIHRYQDGQLSVFAEGPQLESPNGLLVEGNRLLVAGWGLAAEDFSTKIPGRLFALDLKTKNQTLLTKEPTGNLDGLESDGAGGYIVTDYVAGKVLHITAQGAVTALLKLPAGSADHAFVPEKKLLIVPQMNENKVTAFRVGPVKQ